METIEIPVKVSAGFTKLGPDDMPLEQRMRVWAAISLYLDRKVSIGKAAELAEMDSVAFHEYLGEHQIPVTLITYKELQDEIKMLKETGRL
jgi:predicted HTH domain antitoxin